MIVKWLGRGKTTPLPLSKIVTEHGMTAKFCLIIRAKLLIIKCFLCFLQKDIHKPEILHIDLDCIDDIPLVLQKALSMHGHIDILINNAGISYRGTIENTEIRVHQHLMNVNYFGAVMLTKGNKILIIYFYLASL